MDITEHLLTCLSEECSEVAKECAKSQRFGLDEKLTMDPYGPRGTEGPTNAQKLINELNDLLGVVQMLVDVGAIAENWQCQAKQEAKKLKVPRFMDYAVRCGTLTPFRPAVMVKKNQVIRYPDGIKSVVRVDKELPAGAEIIANFPHEDEDYSYICDREFCRCLQ